MTQVLRYRKLNFATNLKNGRPLDMLFFLNLVNCPIYFYLHCGIHFLLYSVATYSNMSGVQPGLSPV